MTANKLSTTDRQAAIIAFAQTCPELSYRAIGAKFGVTGSCVAQIIAGKRGKRRQAHLVRLLANNTSDGEFGAIRMVIAALGPFDEPARERIIQYALSKLRDNARAVPPNNQTHETPRALADPGPKPLDAVDVGKGDRVAGRTDHSRVGQ